MDLKLRGRKAIITGGSRGIGRAIAECFAEEGCDVGICARGEDGVKSAVENVDVAGGAAAPVASVHETDHE